MNVTAVLIVDTPVAFSWLGHMPVCRWVMSHLQCVRGVNKVVCLATPPLCRRASSLLDGTGAAVLSMPEAVVQSGAVNEYLCAPDGPSAGGDVTMSVRSTVPLLSAGKMEQCVVSVTGGRCAVCVLVREVAVVHFRGATESRQVLPEPVGGVRVFAARPLSLRRPAAHYGTVCVSAIEALDATDVEGRRLIEALVAAGQE